MEKSLTRKAVFVHRKKVPGLIDVDSEMVHEWLCRDMWRFGWNIFYGFNVTIV